MVLHSKSSIFGCLLVCALHYPLPFLGSFTTILYLILVPILGTRFQKAAPVSVLSLSWVDCFHVAGVNVVGLPSCLACQPVLHQTMAGPHMEYHLWPVLSSLVMDYSPAENCLLGIHCPIPRVDNSICHLAKDHLLYDSPSKYFHETELLHTTYLHNLFLLSGFSRALSKFFIPYWQVYHVNIAFDSGLC